MRLRTGVLVTLAAGAIALGSLPSAAGAATNPPNDQPQNATVISSLPFSQTLNTSAAVTDDVERKAMATCSFPGSAVRKGVWYRFTPAKDMAVRFSAEGSSYSASVAVFTGFAPNFQPVIGPEQPFCFAGPSLLVNLKGGTRYSILAFDGVAGSAGGTLRFSARTAIPAPTVDVNAQAKGILKAGGVVRLRGTASCRGKDAVLLNVSGALSQARGAGQAFGFFDFFLSVRCGNTPISWQADVIPQPFFPEPPPGEDPVEQPPVPFAVGSASLDLSAFASGPDGFGFVNKPGLAVNVVRP